MSTETQPEGRTGTSTATLAQAGRDNGDHDRRKRIDAAIRAFQAGNDRESSFRVLYKLFFPTLCRFFGRRGFPADDSLDLTQETFLSIYNGLRGFRQEARFETWMFTVATNTYRKRLRALTAEKRDGKEVSHEDLTGGEAALEAPGTQLDELLDGERRKALRAAIAELPAQMRRCLVLRLYHDHSYQEIAVLLKIKIDTVKAHLFQARKRLKEQVNEAFED